MSEGDDRDNGYILHGKFPKATWELDIWDLLKQNIFVHSDADSKMPSKISNVKRMKRRAEATLHFDTEGAAQYCMIRMNQFAMDIRPGKQGEKIVLSRKLGDSVYKKIEVKLSPSQILEWDPVLARELLYIKDVPDYLMSFKVKLFDTLVLVVDESKIDINTLKSQISRNGGKISSVTHLSDLPKTMHRLLREVREFGATDYIVCGVRDAAQPYVGLVLDNHPAVKERNHPIVAKNGMVNVPFILHNIPSESERVEVIQSLTDNLAELLNCLGWSGSDTKMDEFKIERIMPSKLRWALKTWQAERRKHVEEDVIIRNIPFNLWKPNYINNKLLPGLIIPEFTECKVTRSGCLVVHVVFESMLVAAQVIEEFEKKHRADPSSMVMSKQGGLTGLKDRMLISEKCLNFLGMDRGQTSKVIDDFSATVVPFVIKELKMLERSTAAAA